MTPLEQFDREEQARFEIIRNSLPHDMSHSIPADFLKSHDSKRAEIVAREAVEEIVICAAVYGDDGTIIRCHRHSDGIKALRERDIPLIRTYDAQGFITSKNRYVSREEGRRLQDAAGIASKDKNGYKSNTLFSEDLY